MAGHSFYEYYYIIQSFLGTLELLILVLVLVFIQWYSFQTPLFVLLSLFVRSRFHTHWVPRYLYIDLLAPARKQHTIAQAGYDISVVSGCPRGVLFLFDCRCRLCLFLSFVVMLSSYYLLITIISRFHFCCQIPRVLFIAICNVSKSRLEMQAC